MPGTLPCLWAGAEQLGGTCPRQRLSTGTTSICSGGPTLYALEPGYQQAASTTPGQLCSGPQASLGTSPAPARPRARGAVPTRETTLLWPLVATH